MSFQPNHERKPLDEMNTVDDEDIDQQVDAKDHPVRPAQSIGAVGKTIL